MAENPVSLSFGEMTCEKTGWFAIRWRGEKGTNNISLSLAHAGILEYITTTIGLVRHPASKAIIVDWITAPCEFS